MTEIQGTTRDYEMFNRLLEGVQVIGFDWKYLFVNDAVLRHARTSWEDLLGKTMMEAYPGIEDTAMFATLKDVMDSRVAAKMNNQFAYPDGREGWFALSIQPWPDGILILSLDITAEKKLAASASS
jgi:hypothetical protein